MRGVEKVAKKLEGDTDNINLKPINTLTFIVVCFVILIHMQNISL